MAPPPAAGAATWRCCGPLLTRSFSPATRRGARPGGQELGRLPLDDLGSGARPAGGLELLFGLSPCLLALRAARRRVARLLIQAGRSGLEGQRAELLREAEARAIPVLRPRRRELDVLSRHQVHQGVCMEVSPLRPRPWAEAEAEKARPGDGPQQLWLVLEGLQDPRNLGAVLRSAHFLGVDKVITSRRNSCPLTPVVSKASAGAMEVMDVFSIDDLAGFLQSQRLPSHWPLGCSLFVTLAWERGLWSFPGSAGLLPASPHHPARPAAASWTRVLKCLRGCRNPSSLHLQPEEGVPSGSGERATSPRTPGPLGRI